MQRILILFFFTSIFTSSFSQNLNGKLLGEIVDKEKKPLEGAIVSILKSKDSTLVKTSFTEKDGTFEFSNLEADTFFISINLSGYENYFSNSIVINEIQPQLTLPPISLQNSASMQLNEVTVSSKLPFVEKKIDRIVVNPEALISNAGTNALEVLEKSPGIQVNMNGEISLKGKQGVLVYIDDKPTYLSSADLSNYLKSISSSSIGVIEIMTNPPAKYDAAGNAGIINIKIKKTRTKGFNGGVTISYGQGFYGKSNNSFNLNYRINKVNFFCNGNYNALRSYQDLDIHRKYYNSSGQLNSAFNQNTLIRMKTNSMSGKVGMDYYISSKATFGIVASGFNTVTDNNSTNISQVKDSSEALVTSVIAKSPTKRVFNNGNLNVNYDYIIDTLGKQLTFNADYSVYDSKTDQSLLSNTYLPDQTLINTSNLISNLPSYIDIKSAKLDYVNPLKNNMRIDGGIKTSFVSTNNIANFYDENSGIQTVNNDFSNHFKYKESINAAYINFTGGGKKITVQAGLRFENTFINGTQLGNSVHKDSSFTRNYNNLFPTLYLLYKLDTLDKHQLAFSYGRRIDRPNYQDMNPFTYPLDRFTLYSGNPFLKPTFSDNLELSHTYKNIFTTTISYSYVTNVISETIEQDTATFYSRPGNIGKQVSYGISINGTISIAKWWTLQIYSELMSNSYTSVLYNQQLNNTGMHWYIGPTNQFQLKNNWALELSGNYQTKVYVGQFVVSPVGAVRIGVSKKILKNKGTVKLNVSDIFYTNQPGGEIQGLSSSAAGWHSYLDTRVITVAFSYRFNKGQSLAARTVTGADEKARVK